MKYKDCHRNAKEKDVFTTNNVVCEGVEEERVLGRMISDLGEFPTTKEKVLYLRTNFSLSTAYIARMLGVTYQYVYRILPY